jgi:tetraacyldisaccharide 4'-kinase
MAVRSRAGLYSRGVLSVRRLDRPVISIGNLTLGGTGKTPLTIYLAQILLSWGLTPILLSRGYGRIARSSARVVAPGQGVTARPDDVGDEPALIRRRVPGIWLGISADRWSVANEIPYRDLQAVFLLDDGFQHLQLHRDLDIVLVHSAQPFLSNRVLPLGSLREPVQSMRRCDVVMLNGLEGTADWISIKEEISRIHAQAGLFCCRQHIGRIERFELWRACSSGPEAASGIGPVFLVSAIAGPGRFRSDVEALGIQVRGERTFRDHCRLTDQDWLSCVGAARRTGAAALLTTEKDAVKLEDTLDFPLLVAVQETIIGKSAAFEALLRRKCERAR